MNLLAELFVQRLAFIRQQNFILRSLAAYVVVDVKIDLHQFRLRF